MPEQQIACASEHAHPFEHRAGLRVARATVRRMQPQHIRLGAQAQMRDDGGVHLRFAGLESASHAALQ